MSEVSYNITNVLFYLQYNPFRNELLMQLGPKKMRSGNVQMEKAILILYLAGSKKFYKS